MSSGAWFVATVLAFGLPLLPLLVCYQLRSATMTPWSVVLFVQYALCVVAGLRLAGMVRRGSPDLLHAYFWVFAYIAIAVPGAIQLSLGALPWPVDLSVDNLLMAQLLIIAGCAAFDFGYLATRGRLVRNGSQRPGYQIVVGRLWLLLGLYVVALPALIAQRGGIAALFVDRTTSYNLANFSSGAQFGIVTVLLRGVPAIVICAALLARRRSVTRSSTGVLSLITLPVFLVVNNPLSSNRYWFIAVSLMVLVSWRDWSPVARSFLVLGSAASGLVLFPLLNYFRNPGHSHVTTGMASLTTGDYDVLQTTAMAVRWVDEVGITWGHQLLGVALFWVPRSIWAAKPMDTGPQVAGDLGLSFTNLSSPLWVEGYVNLGVLGAVALLGAFGAFAAFIGWRALARGDERSQLIWGFLVGFQLILLRGSLLQAAGQLAFMVLLISAVTSSPDRRSGMRRPRLTGQS